MYLVQSKRTEPLQVTDFLISAIRYTIADFELCFGNNNTNLSCIQVAGR